MPALTAIGLVTSKLARVRQATSSPEAELMALGSGLNKSIHIMELIKEVQHGMRQHIFDIPDHIDPQPHLVITLHTDSTLASSLASNLAVNKRSRHISLKYLWLQDEDKRVLVNISCLPTSDNPADLFTRLLPTLTIHRHLGPCGLHRLPTGEGDEQQAAQDINILLDSVVKLHIKHH